MLHVFTKADTARMRANGNIKFCSHQQHGQHFVDSAQATAINLAIAYRTGLQELFEDDAILAMLACGDADGRDCARYLRVTEHVVGRSRLFNPVWAECCQLFHPTDSL